MAGSSPQDKDFPWWLVIVVMTAAGMFIYVAENKSYAAVFGVMAKGIWVTIYVTLISYGLACLLGLGLALGQLSRWLVVRQICRLYVEVMRGIPIMVLLLYVAFALSPLLVAGWNWITGPLGFAPAQGRDFPLIWRAVMGGRC